MDVWFYIYNALSLSLFIIPFVIFPESLAIECFNLWWRKISECEYRMYFFYLSKFKNCIHLTLELSLTVYKWYIDVVRPLWSRVENWYISASYAFTIHYFLFLLRSLFQLCFALSLLCYVILICKHAILSLVLCYSYYSFSCVMLFLFLCYVILICKHAIQYNISSELTREYCKL